ncbi:uncharacterized protein AB675_7805 [Cyphellophora attinorum]|uniref:Uncharacterized protein n=1 Tax=Cyphellophora attinorum TaxID=1664694 RepID=A0A0N1HBE5_9EURO|nr:uncharacterized protein AB675_7805 [Phialophora attinorum]KPI40575.1 hypothetical protein AB675_7805 [Phialophora attinorum]
MATSPSKANLSGFSEEKIPVDLAKDVEEGSSEKTEHPYRVSDSEAVENSKETMTLESSAPNDSFFDEPLESNSIGSGSHFTLNGDKNKLLSSSHGKQAPRSRDDKQAMPHDDDKQTLDLDGKQVLGGNADKIVATRFEPGQTDSPTTTLDRSQMDVSQLSRGSGSYQEYAFCHASALRLNHNVVIDPNGGAIYFVEVAAFAKGRVDVVVHHVKHELASKGATLTADEGKLCSVVGFAQFPHDRDNLIQIGLGDHHDMSSVKWLELKRTHEIADWTIVLPGSLSHELQLATNLDSSTRSSIPSASPISPLDSKSSTGSFRLVETSTGAVIAAYSELKTMSSWKKRGKLRIYDRSVVHVNMLSGEDLQLLIVLCCASMNEKRRRASVRKWTAGVF